MSNTRLVQRTAGGFVLAVGVVSVVITTTATAARADLKLCNATAARVGVAIGYQSAAGWTTEGWWNISAKTCETLLKGRVPSRYIYVYAIDYERGGEWAGSTMMCTAPKTFSIKGVDKCTDRGFQQSGFYEVDTGDAADWTVRLTDPQGKKQKPRS